MITVLLALVASLLPAFLLVCGAAFYTDDGDESGPGQFLPASPHQKP